jgi:hypothetical protein
MIVSLQRARDALQNQGRDSAVKEKEFRGRGTIFAPLVGGAAHQNGREAAICDVSPGLRVYQS